MVWKPTALAALLLLISGCIHLSALVPDPSDTGAPDGCSWVVKNVGGGNDTLYLCCAEPEKLKPVCKEAGWYVRKE